MLNTAILMGRLTADPELRYTTSNIPVTSFTLAVDRAYKSGEEKQTDFINIVAWRQRAEFVSKWFKKGQLVAVEGSIQTRRYTDKDGNNRTAFEIVANNVHFAEKRDASSAVNDGAAPSYNAAPAAPSFSNTGADDFSELPGDDELPF